MLIDRTHRSWAMISTVILALGTVSYLAYAGSADKGATGGSLAGLIYGVIGMAMMIFAGLLAARKKVPFWRLGSAQFWLRGHLWLGALSFPFILFHAGFAFGGLLEQILMWIFVVVWASGFYGLAMQSLLPRLLTSRIDRETFLAQVPYLRRRNRIMSDRMIFEHCGAIPLTGDPMQKELERLIRHGKKVKELEDAGDKDGAKSEKARWTEHVNDLDLALFRDIAKISKGNGWIRTVNDLTRYLFDVYSVQGISDLKETPEPDRKTAQTEGSEKKKSPLDQIKTGGTRKKASPLDQIKAGGPGRKASPLDQIKAAGAGGKSDSESEEVEKKLSPLDQIKAGGPGRKASPLDQIKAAGAGGKSDSESEEVEKKLSPLDQIKAGSPGRKASPLDQIKAAGAGGKSDSESEEEEESLSPLDQIKAGGPGRKASPLDQIKAAGAGGKSDSESEEEEKRLSPLDQIKAGGPGRKASPLDQIKAAGAGGGASSESEKEEEKVSPLDQIRASQRKPVSPVVASEGSSPLDRIRGQAAKKKAAVVKAAAPAKKSTGNGPMLRIVRDVEAEVESISRLFEQKYGYSKELAADLAGSTRPFLKARPRKVNAPEPVIRFVPDIESELTAIETLLTEKYGYSSNLAFEVSSFARPFLKSEDEDPDRQVMLIRELLTQKYDYDPALAEEIAERVRPFVAGTGDVRDDEAEADVAEADVAEADVAEADVKESEKAAASVVSASATDRRAGIDLIRGQGAAGSGPGKAAASSVASAAPKPKKKAPPKAIIEKKKSGKSPVLRTKELREFYLEEVRPYLAGNPRRGRLSSRRESNRAFNQMRSTLPVELHESLAALQARSDEHRQFAEQERIHHWLHYWLALHIPFSMVLYVLMLVHIVMALRVVPFSLSDSGG